MGAYMYPITIDYNRKTKKVSKEIRVDNRFFNKKDLIKLIDKWELMVFLSNGDEVIIELSKDVPETNKEMNLRIKKEESYMKEYNARQEAKNKQP